MNTTANTFESIRSAIADLEVAPRIEPNTEISPEQAFLPAGHRGVLDLRRQLVVGNRGMGKSFWTHALLNQNLRNKLADHYQHAELKTTEVKVGFNGSVLNDGFAPTVDEVVHLQTETGNSELIWKGVLLRIASSMSGRPVFSLPQSIAALQADPTLYSSVLSDLDRDLFARRHHLLVVFDALDRLGHDWQGIRDLSRALLRLSIGLQSFRSIRAKIFMRVDQFSDRELFKFPDSSKIRNDHVNLIWQPGELYGLLLFNILRSPAGKPALETLASQVNAKAALPIGGGDSRAHLEQQRQLIHAIAGEFMGSNRKRGLVYTWVPLHLSDAADTCSPRTFLTAWRKAAEHLPPPLDRAVDHLGLLDGVRSASQGRLNELYEDYEWISPSLDALKRQFVPMSRDQLFQLWQQNRVIDNIKSSTYGQVTKIPASLTEGSDLEALLEAMKSVAVMEERSNGKINVPDIFRVEAGILRKGGVAVPKRR
ncbi:hypothetical protein J2W27_000346 [Variovorax boronicumulans]|uniref:hypothetical protein n=1 Tax=Variovorax boronicumulans TaxID=436515 RepID=UPI00278656E6|nr:hypothetical protein [Variovorax boronicumulans]MDP9908253.1 hypothetical protein [Variovorax boronicumulans]